MEPLRPGDPQVVGPWTLLQRLGSGGMGVVYLASRDQELVALKVVRSHFLDDPGLRERFAREVDTLYKLDSPFIATVIDADATGDLAWVATEFVNGPNLKTRIDEQGPLGEQEWKALARGLLLALKATHASGIVHRDVKPANILLTGELPKLIDFGIAQASDATSLTTTGLIAGSPAWLSPEQIDDEEVGAASDLFSAGSVLAYAATGRQPWGSAGLPTSVTLARITQSEPDLAGLSGLQAQIIGGLLAKNPSERLTLDSALAMLDTGAPSSPPPPPPTAPISQDPTPPAASSPSARNSGRLIAVVASLVAVAIVGVVVLVAALGSGESDSSATDANTMDANTTDANTTESQEVDATASGQMADGVQADGAPLIVGDPGDLECTIGTLLPQSGNLSFLGPPMDAGVYLAVEEIQGANGPIARVIDGDSGDTFTDLATVTVDQLLDSGVSAIVGPASSSVALMVLDQVTSNGVLLISPSNTSPQLSSDQDRGLYFRTVPADPLQGVAIAELLQEAGAQSVAIVAVDDIYGTSVAEAAADTFSAQGGTVTDTVLYDFSTSSFRNLAQRVASGAPQATVVIGFQESVDIVRALDQAGVGPQDVPMFLSDGNLSTFLYSELPRDLMVGVKGVLPGSAASPALQDGLLSVNPGLEDFAYAAESYDAVNLIALGMAISGTCDGPAVAQALRDISRTGEPCTNYAECMTLLQEGRDIDYVGLSGPVDLAANGDIAAATIGVVEFTSNDDYQALTPVTVEVADPLEP